MNTPIVNIFKESAPELQSIPQCGQPLPYHDRPLTIIEKLICLQELINFAMMNGGKQHINVIDSVVTRAISQESGVCNGLNAKDAEDISSLFLEVKFL